jgi:hypothetical protein
VAVLILSEFIPLPLEGGGDGWGWNIIYPLPFQPREGRFLEKGVMSTHRVVGKMQRPFQFQPYSKFKGGKK